MLRRTAFANAMALVLATTSFAANADILFANLGTAAPPANVGGHAMTPFDQAPQAAISEFTDVSIIPGGPDGSTVGISPNANKRTVGSSWGTWSHGYTGALYFASEVNQVTMTLPAHTSAFYFYVNPNPFAFHAVTATTNTGETSEAIQVTGASGANGFAFYSTAGETIASITITSTADFGVGEFGIAAGDPTTCASEGYMGMKLIWCQNICENELITGRALDTWIHRWIGRYRALPYCAAEEVEEEEGNQET